MRNLVLIKGAGDLASGVAHRLYLSGFPVVMTEIARPTVIRRTVAFAEAVFDGCYEVEGITARLAAGLPEARAILDGGEIPVLIDPRAETALQLLPAAAGTASWPTQYWARITDAPLVIGLGPGFTAGVDVHAVVETNRGTISDG